MIYQRCHVSIHQIRRKMRMEEARVGEGCMDNLHSVTTGEALVSHVEEGQ